MLCFAKRLQIRQEREWNNLLDKMSRKNNRHQDNHYLEEMTIPGITRNSIAKERVQERIQESVEKREDATPQQMVDVGYIDPYSMEVAHLGHMSESSLDTLLKEYEFVAYKVTPENEPEEEEEEGSFGRRRTVCEPSLPVVMEVPSQESSVVSNIKTDKDNPHNNQISRDEIASTSHHTRDTQPETSTAHTKRRKYGYFRSHSTTCATSDHGRIKRCSLDEQYRTKDKDLFVPRVRRQSVPLIDTKSTKITRSVEDGYAVQLKRNSRGRLIESSV